MANEANVRTSLQLRTGNINYQSQPTSFNADVAGQAGPTPGYILATTSGVSVDLSKLTQPGLCRIMNLSEDNVVHVGVYVATYHDFVPMMELLPGESYIIRLSRDLGDNYFGAGTGTGIGANSLQVRANSGTAGVLVEAFEV